MLGQARVDGLLAGIVSGNRRALAQAITLVESERIADAPLAAALMAALPKRKQLAKRIGISGPPGVGKSTLIEALGASLLLQGQRVAVLAIDPTSPIAGGSILGDKVRMPQLATASNAYVRPSAARGLLGGIGLATPEALMLCEAAGFDTIIVESVGVGQSEYSTALATDCFVLLVQPHAGDDLQAIKRGVLELSDVLAVTKADGETRQGAQSAQHMLKQNLAFTRQSPLPEILLLSAPTNVGIDSFWQAITAHFNALPPDILSARRSERFALLWQQSVPAFLWQALSCDSVRAPLLQAATERVTQGDCAPLTAARGLYASLFA